MYSVILSTAIYMGLRTISAMALPYQCQFIKKKVEHYINMTDGYKKDDRVLDELS